MVMVVIVVLFCFVWVCGVCEDPLQGDFPEVIEEYLENGVTKCIAFNRRGTLLAAGCMDGSCVIWDFETRGIAKELKDKDCVAAITSVCWSKYGHRILVSAMDKSITLWDVVKGEKITRTVLPQAPFQAYLHPGSSTPSLCLACPFSTAPMIVDLNTESTTVLPVSLPETDTGSAPPSRNKFSDGSAAFTPTSACFNKCGDLVYVGNSKGEILIIDHKNEGQYLLTNSNDRTIRIYENLLPLKDGLKALDESSKIPDELDGVENFKAVGAKCLALFREFQDAITKIHWNAPCFSGDGEWVVGASANRYEHKIYIWDRAGHLVKILEGPKDGLLELAWHPVHPIVVSVSLGGLVYIWAKDYTENWSAFAPDFKELEENEEYVEREDEFDLIPETGKVKESDVNEDDEVDIMSVEKDDFSDSDMSQGEICFLPAIPCPDVPEQLDKCVESSSKLVDSNHSGLLLSEEAGQNGQAMNHEASPIEEGNAEMISMSYKKLPVDVKPGNTILCADGTISLTVLSCDPAARTVRCCCQNTAVLGERKNVNLPGVVVDLPTLTEKDKEDILEWGVPNNIDMIALSFVRKGSDLVNVRKVLGIHAKHIQLMSKEGQYVLTNSNDRTIRIYENLLPLKDGLKALDESSKIPDELDGVENFKAVGAKCLALFREFQDAITKIHWNAPCFSGDGEWVVGASANRYEHKIYIWDRAGHLVKILEGPKDGLLELAWHPVHPIVVSVSLGGLVYIWAKDYTENWSAFAPDFKELEENEEYVEREDEFDLIPETGKVKESDVNEDDEVDIMSVEKDDFSDSDMSQGEICFLPAIPCPDVPEQLDKCVESSSKLVDSNHSGSLLSEEAGQNGQAMNHEASPIEVMDNSAAEDTRPHLKRRRKPSEKVLELQAEKVRKPLKKINPSGKSSKIKDKPVIEQDTVFADDVSE
ncbi:hypothetical protein TEA_022756 [Camellia sinensis var. sinensis]|uniref:pyruvate kinase n=1 Tax=Camellia sinensis var. sinensis TaxID=542762 RepID=A0A4S4D6K7_CAMSN|nr:hypothetical protein TEA_022756 [Camellia sinensis var. sinensis]